MATLVKLINVRVRASKVHPVLRSNEIVPFGKTAYFVRLVFGDQRFPSPTPKILTKDSSKYSEGFAGALLLRRTLSCQSALN